MKKGARKIPDWTRASDLHRFMSKVEKVNRGHGSDCWEWTACKCSLGYGVFAIHPGRFKAHRVAKAWFHGPLDRSKEIDHLCRNPSCVNPDHLEEVSAQINTLRGESLQAQNAVKTHCPKGHPYDLFNTYYPPKGGRECRECVRQSQRRYQARKKAAAK